MKKRGMYAAASAVFTVLVCIFIWRVYCVNAAYPKAVLEEHSVGEEFSWQDFDVKVVSYDILNNEQVREQWGVSDTTGIENDDLIIAAIEVTYKGEEESKKFPIVKVKGQAGAWYNSSELICVKAFNDNNTVCQKNVTRTLYTAIGISRKRMTGTQIESMKRDGIQLVFQTYPDVVYVNLVGK